MPRTTRHPLAADDSKEQAGACQSLYQRAALMLMVSTLLCLPGRAAQAQDSRQLQDVEHRAPPAPTLSQVFETDDGFTVWRKDINVQCSFSDHHYTLDITTDPAELSDISYTMTNYDVDYNDPQGCWGGPEVDLMYFNGQYVGYLEGANNSWSVNSWPLSATQLVSGANSIYIDTDAPETGCWCVGVGYIEVRAKAGFKVVAHTPLADDKNRDFRADKLDLTVTFSKEYDHATVTSDTVRLEYRSAAGAWQQVAGHFTQLEPKQLRLVPNSHLKDGIRYRVTVKGGPSGVKTPGGTAMPQDKVWYFHTVPDLSVTDAFDYGGGSVCAPSTAPCPGVELAIFQVARNAPMVPGGKPAVARLYLRWKRHTDVHPDDQVLETEIESSITVDGKTYVHTQPVRRPDHYTTVEREAAAHTINIYHTPLSDFGYSAAVAPRPQSNATPVTYTQGAKLGSTGQSPNIGFDHYFLQAGDWSSGVPSGSQVNGIDTMTAGSQLITETFPILGTMFTQKGMLEIDYKFSGSQTTSAICGTQQRVSCTRPDGTTSTVTELNCANIWLKTMLGGNAFVAATVPQSLCPNSAALTLNNQVVFHMSGNGANDGTIARQVGFIHGIPSLNDDSTGVEGFQVSTGTNRSFVESPTRAISLMHTQVQPQGTQWISNIDYSTLLESGSLFTAFQVPWAAAVEITGPYLIVSGFIDVGSGSVDLISPFLQERPNDVASATGMCRVELVDGIGVVLARDHVTPGNHVALRRGDGSLLETFSGDFGPQPFSVSLPWSAYARQLRVSCNGTLLFTQARGAHLPVVDFLDLPHGASLSGTRLLSWAGSDADGSSLAYQLQISSDEGASWGPLTPLMARTRYSLDTSRLPSGRSLLRVLVTDGFDTAWSSRAVNLVNPLKVTGVLPASDAMDVDLRAPVKALFVSDVKEGELTMSTFELLEGGSLPVNGKVSYHRSSRTATFTPTAPLKHGVTYVARLSPSLRDVQGNSLGLTYQWSFTTAADRTPPAVVRTSPSHGQMNVPLDALVQVKFNEAMSSSSLTGSSFELLDRDGRLVSGSVVTSSDQQSAIFIASAPLMPGMEYMARLSPSVSDAAGNALGRGFSWRFTAGATASKGLRIIGNYTDQALDMNGDGLFERLTVNVDVEVRTSASYNLNGRLLDPQGSLVAWESTSNLYLERGVHTLKLAFSSVPIRSNGVDGPYTLDALNFYDTRAPSISDTKYRAYRTSPYRAASFYSLLTLSKLPDQLLRWSTTREAAFNLRDYTTHGSQPVGSVAYKILFNTDPRVAVSIDSNGDVDIRPQAGVEAESDVMIEARDLLGNRVVSQFHVSVQRPRPSRLVAPEELQVPAQQSQQVDVRVQDQWGHLLTSEVTVRFESTQGQLSPASVTTSTGMASTTLTAGSQAGLAFVTSLLGELSALTRVQILAGERSLYPIAVHADAVHSARPGQALNLTQGLGAGSFGWLSWTGDLSESALARSLTPPGNSQSYVNPHDPSDRVLSEGDWVSGKPGVSNSRAVREALEALKLRRLTVPVWRDATGAGQGVKYLVTGFACIQLTHHKPGKQELLSAVLLGSSPCP
jgi:hypothetical protein